MKRPRSHLAAPLFAALLCFARHGQAAELRTVAPAGPGQDALEVSVDLAASAVRFARCSDAACATKSGPATTIPITLDKTRIDAGAVTTEALSLGEGKHLVHVKIPDREQKDAAFEVLVSASSPEPLFAGLTGLAQNEQGDGSGRAILIYDKGTTDAFVIVADVREDTRICGQAATPLQARGVDPASMQLRGATMHRLDKKARDAATPVVAEARREGAAPPLGKLLVATGGSTPGAGKLTDGDRESVFHEDRPGDGHGEFATLRAPSEAPLVGVTLTIAPSKPAPSFAAPRTLYLATDERLFRVTLPEDGARKPGASYDVAFAEPLRTTCLAVVLDEAYGQGKKSIDVGIAEVVGRTRFDAEGATLDDVAGALGGPRGDEAAAVLRRAGEPGLRAVVPRFDGLDARGRALAIDVAASAGACDGPAIEVVVKALADKDGEVRKRALGRVERCGKNAAQALAQAVRSEDEARRSAAAPLLAAVAPSQALEPLASVMGQGSAATRQAVRGAFARAASSQSRDRLLPLLAEKDLSDEGRLDRLRALGPKLAELKPEADAQVGALLRTSNDLRTRWLLAQPLAHLARASSATEGELSLLASFIQKDPDWQVRAQAVAVSGGVPELEASVLTAANDPQPRVREAALKAIGAGGLVRGRDALRAGLAGDPWTFVRVAAAEATSRLPADPASERVLVDALADKSSKVRSAAITALGRLKATGAAATIEKRLGDEDENVEVRITAARALGAMCVQHAVDALQKLSALALSPESEADDRLGMAAIEALGAIHPKDLEKRLAPLRDKNVRTPVRFAADRASTDPPACR